MLPRLCATTAGPCHTVWQHSPEASPWIHPCHRIYAYAHPNDEGRARRRPALGIAVRQPGDAQERPHPSASVNYRDADPLPGVRVWRAPVPCLTRVSETRAPRATLLNADNVVTTRLAVSRCCGVSRWRPSVLHCRSWLARISPWLLIWLPCPPVQAVMLPKRGSLSHRCKASVDRKPFPQLLQGMVASPATRWCRLPPMANRNRMARRVHVPWVGCELPIESAWWSSRRLRPPDVAHRSRWRCPSSPDVARSVHYACSSYGRPISQATLDVGGRELLTRVRMSSWWCDAVGLSVGPLPRSLCGR